MKRLGFAPRNAFAAALAATAVFSGIACGLNPTVAQGKAKALSASGTALSATSTSAPQVSATPSATPVPSDTPAPTSTSTPVPPPVETSTTMPVPTETPLPVATVPLATPTPDYLPMALDDLRGLEIMNYSPTGGPVTSAINGHVVARYTATKPYYLRACFWITDPERGDICTVLEDKEIAPGSGTATWDTSFAGWLQPGEAPRRLIAIEVDLVEGEYPNIVRVGKYIVIDEELCRQAPMGPCAPAEPHSVLERQ